MIHGLGLVLESGWGLEKGIVRMCEEVVKQQQQKQQLRGRKRKEEKEEAIHVTEDLPVLLMLPLDPEVLEIHIVRSGLEGKMWETNPTGQESEPHAQLPV